MSIARALDQRRVIELVSTSRDAVFSELVGAIVDSKPGVDGEMILRCIRDRERLTSTRIGKSIAIPHARVESLPEPVIAVGRSRAGIRYDEQSPEPVHLVVLIVSADATHLDLLSSVATRLAVPGIRARLIGAADVDEIYEVFSSGATTPRWEEPERERSSDVLLRGAVMIARSTGAGALLVHTDRRTPLLEQIAEEFRVLALTSETSDGAEPHALVWGRVTPLHFPFESIGIESRIELSLLFARVAGHLEPGTRVVSVLASRRGFPLDRLSVCDSSGRLGSVLEGAFSDTREIDHRVFARVLQLALTLAVEGREGKPVGTIFVVGAIEQVLDRCQQLIANPFVGYDDAAKNILDPSMEESIKEYAKIDGAFIVRSDGVIVSAGTYITTSNISVALPRGLGSRHMAASSITAVTEAIAIALSESTRTVSIFRRGVRIAELTAPVG